MRRFLLIFACLLAACSDDSSNGTQVTNNSTANTNSQTTSSNHSNNGSTSQTTNTTRSNNDLDAGMDAESDAARDMGQDVAPDADDDVAVDQDFDQDPCAFPSTDAGCPTGPYGPGSFMTSIQIPETATCCFDFTGDGVADNKIGQLLALASGLGFDVNVGIEVAIANGTLVNLLAFSHMENEADDPTLDLTFLKGTDTDFDFGPNLLGLGDFYVLLESLNANQQPKWTFGSARVRAGRLEAFDGVFDLDFPDLLDQVRIPVVKGRIEADVLPGAELAAGGRVTLDAGKLGGVVLRDEFFASLNDASIACSCLSRAVYDRQANGGYVCNATAADVTNCASQSSGCRFLADPQTCGLLGTAVSNSVDVDADGDGEADSYSFGANFTGVGASLVGNQP